MKEDITLRRRSEELVHRLAYYDPLTGLPNRADAARPAAARRSWPAPASGEFGMLLLLDIDRFKQLNDTRGHAVGDELLRAIARRLRQVVDEAATIAARAMTTSASSSRTWANGLRMRCCVPRRWPARSTSTSTSPTHSTAPSTLSYVTQSIGITLFKGRQWSQENLFKQAEVALFAAKDEGRNTIRFFSPQMQSMVDAHAAAENGLRAALANAAFRLFYQPQVDAGGSGRGRGGSHPLDR